MASDTMPMDPFPMNSCIGCHGCPMMNMPLMPQIEIPQMMVDLEDEDDSDEDSDSYDYFCDLDRNLEQTVGKRADVSHILREIERNNPAIFGTLNMYGIPYPVAHKLVKRMIGLTKRYS